MKKEDLEKAKEIEARIKALELLKIRISAMTDASLLRVSATMNIIGLQVHQPTFIGEESISCEDKTDIDFVIRAIDVRIENLNEEFKKI